MFAAHSGTTPAYAVIGAFIAVVISYSVGLLANYRYYRMLSKINQFL